MGKMTMSKLDAEIRAGRGQGHGDDYRPWLYLRRRNPSPVSCQVSAHMPLSRRAHQYLSRSEYLIALAVHWLMPRDVREQYPVWPQPHEHPLEGAPGGHVGLPRADGLLAIAADLGIAHGRYVGTDIPYVATLDLMVTVTPTTAAAVEVKPEYLHIGTDAPRRVLERLAITAEYCRRLRISHTVAEGRDLPPALAGNLECIMDGADVESYIGRDDWMRYRDELCCRIDSGISLGDATRAAAETCSLPWLQAVRAMHGCLWHRAPDADLSIRLHMSRPLAPGGAALRDSIAKRLLGAA